MYEVQKLHSIRKKVTKNKIIYLRWFSINFSFFLIMCKRRYMSTESSTPEKLRTCVFPRIPSEIKYACGCN